MPNRSRKQRLPDPATFAISIVEGVTGETLVEKPAPVPEPEPEKNAAAVELGRRGGLVGGKARAAKMTPEERTAAAKKAAAGRWGNKGQAR